MTPFGRNEDRSERSSAERAAAREERERKRLEREALEAEQAAAASEPPAPQEESEPAPPSEPEVWLEEEPEEPVAEEPTAVHRSLESEAAASEQPGRRTISLPRPPPEGTEGQPTDGWDRPVGTVKVRRGEYVPQPGASGIPPHRRLDVPRSGRRWRRIIPLTLLAMVAIAAAVFAWLIFEPFHGKGDVKAAVVVRVPAGSSADDIGDLLADRGVVSSGFFFALRARIDGDREKLRAGTFRMHKGMSYAAALKVLTTAPAPVPVLKITLPEGPSRRELAARVKKGGISGSYLEASKSAARLDPRIYGAPKRATLEGFLFPATYEFRKSDATATRLVAEQLTAFKRNFAEVDMTRAKRGNLTRYDVIIIASMIEREAAIPKDRRLIAAVIYNRLRQGMTLGIDATIRYRLGNWSRPLRVSELQIDSPYNTRTHTGLPPSPIGNPGLAALKAAANPAHVPYLYYVVKPCGDGAHAFSASDAQFERDKQAYERARDKNGGKDPSHC